MAAVETNGGGMDTSARDDDIIKLIEMHKWYGEFHVLKNINLFVRPNERIVICGPSGSGKSTMIRCINRVDVVHSRDRHVVADDRRVVLETSTRSAARSAWCSSTSTCSRT